MLGCVIGMGSFIYFGVVVDMVCCMFFFVSLYIKDEYSMFCFVLYLQVIQ